MAMRVARTAQASVWIAAPVESVWDVVADVTRGGEWSGESLGCEWLDGVSEAQPGALFKGRNQRRGMNWSRVSEVVSAVAPRELVWQTVPSGMYRDSTEWRIGLQEEDGGTTVTEAFRILTMSRAMEMALYLVMPVHRDRSSDLSGDLQRLKAVVEAGRSGRSV